MDEAAVLKETVASVIALFTGTNILKTKSTAERSSSEHSIDSEEGSVLDSSGSKAAAEISPLTMQALVNIQVTSFYYLHKMISANNLP